jgi:hypothetical protein
MTPHRLQEKPRGRTAAISGSKVMLSDEPLTRHEALYLIKRMYKVPRRLPL